MSAAPVTLPEETIVEQTRPEVAAPTTEPTQTGGALLDYFTGKQTLDPKAAVDEALAKIVAKNLEIKNIEEEIDAKKMELINKKNELAYLQQELKRHQGNVGAVFYKRGGKKSKKSHKKTNKKSSRKTR